MATRQILKIDEELCDGCGLCVPSCAEGAIQIVDGKARLTRDDFCDGLGACLGDCPTGALTIEEREAADFDETAVEQNLKQRKPEAAPPSGPSPMGGCPSARAMAFQPHPQQDASRTEGEASALAHWPIKLKLVPPGAPFLKDAELLLAADCAPFALANFHGQIMEKHAVVIGCPKFDDYDEGRNRLTAILQESNVRRLTVVIMEVPCCFGFWKMAQESVAAAGGTVPLRQIVIGVRGDIQATRDFDLTAQSAPF